MSQNINSTTTHLKFSYILILANLLQTDNETKSIKIYTTRSIKNAEAYLKPRQKCKMEISTKTVKDLQLLTVFQKKNSISEV